MVKKLYKRGLLYLNNGCQQNYSGRNFRVGACFGGDEGASVVTWEMVEKQEELETLELRTWEMKGLDQVVCFSDPELQEINSRLGLQRYYEQEPCRVDFQRSYELMASIKEDEHAMITDPQGEKIEVVITKEIVAEALKLPTEGLNMRARDRKVEGVFKKNTAAATFNDINMRQATKKEGKVTYLGAPELLTRIAYHTIGMANNLPPAPGQNTWDSAHGVSPRKTRFTKRTRVIIEESSDDDQEEKSTETHSQPADSQESSDNAEKRARRREMMKTAVAAHQEEPAEKKAHHVREKEAYKRSCQSARETSALWSPTSVQPRTKNPKKRLQVESVQLIQQMWEEVEAAKWKEAEEEMVKKVKAAQEVAFGSSSSTRSPPSSHTLSACQRQSPQSNIVKSKVRDLLYVFWSSETQILPNKKDICRKKIGRKSVVKHPVHLLNDSQIELYQRFKRAHPEVEISLRCFEALKPYFV
ncbi:hypothetical protein L7F22_058264 [Adiantum nelumboides]|nr:hypothetical protein [Adiantum nelumboides]